MPYISDVKNEWGRKLLEQEKALCEQREEELRQQRIQRVTPIISPRKHLNTYQEKRAARDLTTKEMAYPVNHSTPVSYKTRPPTPLRQVRFNLSVHDGYNQSDISYTQRDHISQSTAVSPPVEINEDIPTSTMIPQTRRKSLSMENLHIKSKSTSGRFGFSDSPLRQRWSSQRHVISPISRNCWNSLPNLCDTVDEEDDDDHDEIHEYHSDHYSSINGSTSSEDDSHEVTMRPSPPAGKTRGPRLSQIRMKNRLVIQWENMILAANAPNPCIRSHLN